jgi:hypothetical protein
VALKVGGQLLSYLGILLSPVSLWDPLSWFTMVIPYYFIQVMHSKILSFERFTAKEWHVAWAAVHFSIIAVEVLYPVLLGSQLNKNGCKTFIFGDLKRSMSDFGRFQTCSVHFSMLVLVH